MRTPPKIAVPAARSSAPLLAIRRRLLLGVLIAAAVFGVLSSCVSLTRTTPEVKVPPATADAAVSQAQLVAEAYLNGATSPVPAAKDVSADFARQGARLDWTGLTLSAITRTTVGDDPAVPVKLIRFSVVIEEPNPDSSGIREQPDVPVLYHLFVPMVDTNVGVALAAEPSLMPAPLLESGTVPGASLDNFQGRVDIDQAAPQIRDMVIKWAEAFVGGDPSQLKLLTGEDRVDVVYPVLPGWTLVEQQFGDSVVSAPANDAGVPGVIVRTTLVMHPDADTSNTVTSSYDVWVAIGGADEASPPVVAWGPAGTGLLLTPYMNALVTE